MPLSSRTALCAPSQPATQAASILRVVPSGCFSVAATLVGVLLEADELGVPLHRRCRVAQLLAHDAFVVVLAEDQDVRIGRDVAPGVAQRHARHLAALRPEFAPVPRLPSSSARSTMPSCA